MTIPGLNRGAALAMVFAPLLLGGCVTQQAYDAVVAQNQQLQGQVAAQKDQIAAEKAHVTRLQDAVRYTVDSDLLFTPGGWQMSASGKDIIAKMATKLAPGQQDKLVVTGYTDNAPIGPELRHMGVTSNVVLSQKRADTVMQYMISKGVKPSLVTAQGKGEADPVAPNTTAQGRALNRRVEISLAPSS